MSVIIPKKIKHRLTGYKKSLSEITTKDITHLLDVWGKRSVFYCGFYVSTAIFLILHILIFMSIAWQYPLPLNAGPNLGYTNYPNNKFHFSSNPNILSLTIKNGSLLAKGGYNFDVIRQFVNEIDSTNCTCSQEENSSKKCLLVSLNKVILWKPQLVDLKLAFEDYLPVDCNVTTENHNLTILPCAPGIPLSLNNTNGKSYPFISQDNYIKPKLALEIDFTQVNTEREHRFTLECQLKACVGVNSIHCPVPLQTEIIITK